MEELQPPTDEMWHFVLLPGYVNAWFRADRCYSCGGVDRVALRDLHTSTIARGAHATPRAVPSCAKCTARMRRRALIPLWIVAAAVMLVYEIAPAVFSPVIDPEGPFHWLIPIVALISMLLSIVGVGTTERVQVITGETETRYGFRCREAGEWFAADNHAAIWEPASGAD